MKQLKFTSTLVKLILNGHKSATWRLFDDKDLSVGDSVEFIESESNRRFATAFLTKVIEKPHGQLTDDDKAGHEKYSSYEEMYRSFQYYYKKPVDRDTIVKIIWFKLT